MGAELRFVMSGATGTITSGGRPGLLRNYAGNAAALEGLADRGMTAGHFDTFPLGDSTRNNPVIDGKPCDQYSRPSPRSSLYFPHIAEGINDGAENELVCLMSGDKDVVKEGTGIIHAVGITAQQAQLIKDRGAKVIWSPRTNIFLYGNTAPVTLLRQVGVPMALGTDWLPSGSMNMLRELECARFLNESYFGSTFSDQEIWEMATLNGALVVGGVRDGKYLVGALEVGAVADISIFDSRVNKGYRAAIAASSEDVVLVMRGGKVLYGDAALVDGTAKDAPDCEALDVCGAPKHVCLKNDNTDGVTVARLQELLAAGTLYPLFTCRGQAVEGEPTCQPYRAEYPDGLATDRDGDGVVEGDNCPDIFNPPRPMDAVGGGAPVQSDGDGDGVGDACDETPNGGI